MNTIEDFKNAPLEATATHGDGSRAVKIVDDCWLRSNGFYLEDNDMVFRAYTLDQPAPTTAREALDLAWELAHPVKEGQVIPEGTRYLMMNTYSSGLAEFVAEFDFKILPGRVSVVRILEPLPEPLPEWLDAPAVIAATSRCPDRKVWVPESGGVWKCSCCQDEHFWYELVDVTPLYPKETK